MKLIVGLGNLGREYDETRHNVGFIFLDSLAKCSEIVPEENVISFHTDKKFEAQIAEFSADGEKLLLAKPTTFMNSSGRAVSKIVDFYKINPKDLIVISDDIDLPLGTIRIRKEGSSGGQKGLQNIIDAIGTENFTRIRIGTSTPGEKATRDETIDFVLGKISKREKPIFDKVIEQGVKILAEHLVKKQEIPCHTIEVVAKEQNIEK